jgi:hypothetical protein
VTVTPELATTALLRNRPSRPALLDRAVVSSEPLAPAWAASLMIPRGIRRGRYHGQSVRRGLYVPITDAPTKRADEHDAEAARAS